MQIRFGLANSLVTYFEAKTLPTPHEVLTLDMLKFLSDLLIKYIIFFFLFSCHTLGKIIQSGQKKSL